MKENQKQLKRVMSSESEKENQTKKVTNVNYIAQAESSSEDIEMDSQSEEDLSSQGEELEVGVNEIEETRNDADDS